MSTLDEITQEKQRVSEALARIDAQREKLAGQLGELEATERVLARYSTGTKRTAKSPPSPTKAIAPAQRQATTGKPGDSRRTSATLSDQVLALATGRTQHEIASACKGARPNHVGAALSRHKRAGRIEERDGKLYATHSAGAEQHATA
jgi:ABC-type transporter Mla subunit MlaD